MILRVWCTVKHDDYNVIEMKCDKPVERIEEIRAAGGLQWGIGFVPWHKINYFEAVPD